MQKLVYWIGVYAICVTIHGVLECGCEDLHKYRKRKETEEGHHKKSSTPIGVQPNSEKKPMNKIGFAINSK